jgi:hypothetical protein
MNRCLSKGWLFPVKHRRVVAASVVAVAALRLLVPCPIRGSYVGSLTAAHGCEAHAFLRFADGQAAYFHGDSQPHYWGTYQKAGWNTYTLRGSTNDPFPQAIHVGWLFMRMEDGARPPGHYWLHRDFHVIQDARMVRRARAGTPNPQGGSNKMQPFSSETNRASGAAGSRR